MEKRSWQSAALALLVLSIALSATQVYLLVGRSPGVTVAAPAASKPDPAGQIHLEANWKVVQLPAPASPPPIEFRKRYQFARDWHQRHVAYWTQAVAPFRGKPGVRYLEIGLFEGASFFWVLENVLTDPSSRAVGIDPFIKSYSNIRDYGDTFFANLRLSDCGKRCEVITGFSQIELRKQPLESFDIVYIDGSHDAPDVLEDAVLSWRLLKPGGLLIFDDYDLWLDRPSMQRPRLAIDVFHAFYRGQFEVVHLGYQAMLRRRASAR